MIPGLSNKQAKRIRHHIWRNTQGESRKDARWRIIQLANQHKMRDRLPLMVRVPNPDYHETTNPDVPRTMLIPHFREPTLLGMNNLNRAVRIVRHHKLGNEVLLRSAGFRP